MAHYKQKSLVCHHISDPNQVRLQQSFQFTQFSVSVVSRT